ncbi:MAG: hypothetical protein IPJ03_11075 [Ignavibacteriales bacterium]|nr:hypothetical protein [Ignavibacteriales bacterium]
MKTYYYPLFYKLLFRYGNIPLTFILSAYLVYLVLNIDRELYFVLPTLINLFIIYYLNKTYLRMYKIMPFRIKADDEKLYCDKFIFSKKMTEICYEEISLLQGGIFSGKHRGMMVIRDGKNNFTIGFYHKINGGKALETILLSKVPKPVYDEVINRIGIKK